MGHLKPRVLRAAAILLSLFSVSITWYECVYGYNNNFAIEYIFSSSLFSCYDCGIDAEKKLVKIEWSLQVWKFWNGFFWGKKLDFFQDFFWIKSIALGINLRFLRQNKSTNGFFVSDVIYQVLLILKGSLQLWIPQTRIPTKIFPERPKSKITDFQFVTKLT